MKIVFTNKATQRLVEVANYLYRQNCSKEFVVSYLNKFRKKLKDILIPFPESGTPTPEYGENVRRFVYRDRYTLKMVEVLLQMLVNCSGKLQKKL